MTTKQPESQVEDLVPSARARELTPIMTPGVKTSEFMLSVIAVVGVGMVELANRIQATPEFNDRWWLAPLALALTSAGYALSRGIAKAAALRS